MSQGKQLQKKSLMSASTQHSILRETSCRISTQATALADYLTVNKLSEPSFSTEESQSFLSTNNAELQTIRTSLIEACQTLLDLVTGPEDSLKFNVPVSIQFNSALAVAVRFDFAENVPTASGSSIAFVEMARKTKLHLDRVIRVLRLLITYHVFDEPQNGYVCHTAASRMLLNPGTKAWLGHQFEEMLPASASLVKSFEMYETVESDRETAFSIAHAGDQRKTYWEVLGQSPDKVKRFSDALEYVTSSAGPGDFRPLIACYDWKQFGSSTLVDVGGSSGRVSACIAEYSDPGLKFVVQDLPEMEEEASDRITGLGMNDRMRFEAHNFFKPQPITDARVYIYRQILHDWPDEMAVDILRAAVPALDADDYLLLLEAVQPPPGILPNPMERLIRATDLLMMAKHNAKERTIEMWAELIAKADCRFVLESVTSPEKNPEAGAVIQIRWCPRRHLRN